jgi:hypothetical protein
MIEFSFDFSPLTREFKSLWNKFLDTPFKHKFIELELHTTESLVGFNFLWTTRSDHAGLDLQLSLFGLCLHFNFYDNRHWNHEAGRYYKYSEELGQY